MISHPTYLTIAWTKSDPLNTDSTAYLLSQTLKVSPTFRLSYGLTRHRTIEPCGHLLRTRQFPKHFMHSDKDIESMDRHTTSPRYSNHKLTTALHIPPRQDLTVRHILPLIAPPRSLPSIMIRITEPDLLLNTQYRRGPR